MTTFLLNSGHGEDTAGKRSPFVPPGVVEYAFNRSVAMGILEAAPSAKVEVVHLDPEYDAVPLEEIVRRANAFYANDSDCIFISIHANAASGGETEWVEDAKGVAVLVSPRAGTVSRAFGLLASKCIAKNAFMENRGVRERDLYVLNKTVGPAIITENGFMTHSAEATKLASGYWRRKISLAHIEAMTNWINENRAASR